MIMHLGGDNSQFTLKTNRQDSLYVFEAGCDGYTPQTFTYRVENAKRQWRIEMPTIYLDRAPHKLNELTVTTSKVKFYHRGDTLVYNADAFQLAEGSMLDGLIKQLPGAELSSDGRITVNGEFVESLLLDGKPFFDGNNNLMLKNIGAYMVKNVEVYRGHTEMQKFIGDLSAPKLLTMNVKLKKEYNNGWIFNSQAGYGTDDRYLGRLFAAWFNPRSRVGLVANFNNLNDTRTPGENDNWTPDQMPSGTRRAQMVGLTYSHSDAEDVMSIHGDFTFENNTLNRITTTDRTNFFNSGNTYDYTRMSGLDKNVRLSTRHSGRTKISKVRLNGTLSGGYAKTDHHSASASASFNREQSDMNMQALEAIYSTGCSESLQALMNRAITRSDGTSKKGNIGLETMINYGIPKTNDMLISTLSFKYDTQKESLWDDYDIGYGYDLLTGGPLDSNHQRNFTRNSPNHTLDLGGGLRYMFGIKSLRFRLEYKYDFTHRTRDSYMYALDRLADMGIYGTLPSGYIAAFDPGNSFMSTQLDNRHTGSISIGYNKMESFDKMFSVQCDIALGAHHSHFDYYSDGRFYPIRRTSLIVAVPSTMTSISYRNFESAKGGSDLDLSYQYGLETKLPEMRHLVDIVDTSDPLNIDLGNPGLKNEYIQTHKICWFFRKGGQMNRLDLNATHTANALLRGYVYDMETGVRYNRTY
ncbi:MAG: hypothetical protein K2K92_06945, partial [Duncaniella sp.]|nr:hypothetical protein [Duncaniella sp.]